MFKKWNGKCIEIFNLIWQSWNTVKFILAKSRQFHQLGLFTNLIWFETEYVGECEDVSHLLRCRCGCSGWPSSPGSWRTSSSCSAWSPSGSPPRAAWFSCQSQVSSVVTWPDVLLWLVTCGLTACCPRPRPGCSPASAPAPRPAPWRPRTPCTWRKWLVCTILYCTILYCTVIYLS